MVLNISLICPYYSIYEVVKDVQHIPILKEPDNIVKREQYSAYT